MTIEVRGKISPKDLSTESSQCFQGKTIQNLGRKRSCNFGKKTIMPNHRPWFILSKGEFIRAKSIGNWPNIIEFVIDEIGYCIIFLL
jgi:hypothetical protein